MGPAAVHGLVRSRKRLAHDLAAKDLGGANIMAIAPEKIIVQPLELEQADYVVQSGSQKRILPWLVGPAV